MLKSPPRGGPMCVMRKGRSGCKLPLHRPSRRAGAAAGNSRQAVELNARLNS